MTRTSKYTIKPIEKVKYYMNVEELTKRQAIKKAGFSDSSIYYTTLKRLRLRENLTLVGSQRVSFL